MADSYSMLSTFWPLIMMGGIFYFMLYRPQKKDQQKRREFLQTLKKGQKVVTISGIFAVITDLTEKTATLEIAKGVEIKVLREAISGAETMKIQDQPPKEEA